MSFKLSEIEKINSRSFFNQISNSGTLLQTSWNQNVDLGFSPDFAIVRTVVYNTLSTADAQIYDVLSSLNSNESIATFPGSNSIVGDTIAPIISNPQQLIKLNGEPLSSITFNIVTYTTTGTNKRTTPSTMAATEESSIMLNIDFLKLHRR
tara:strand:- start:1329 stop:1781 length:453 start_codon:yes stop_codon:yes gene_type:complete